MVLTPYKKVRVQDGIIVVVRKLPAASMTLGNKKYGLIAVFVKSLNGSKNVKGGITHETLDTTDQLVEQII